MLLHIYIYTYILQQWKWGYRGYGDNQTMWSLDSLMPPQEITRWYHAGTCAKICSNAVYVPSIYTLLLLYIAIGDVFAQYKANREVITLVTLWILCAFSHSMLFLFLNFILCFRFYGNFCTLLVDHKISHKQRPSLSQVALYFQLSSFLLKKKKKNAKRVASTFLSEEKIKFI